MTAPRFRLAERDAVWASIEGITYMFRVEATPVTTGRSDTYVIEEQDGTIRDIHIDELGDILGLADRLSVVR